MKYFLALLLTVPSLISAEIIITEIAWMGTAFSTSNEWIELYNSGEENVDLTGWMLKTENGSPEIELTGIIATSTTYLLERTDDDTVPEVSADVIYTGALNNEGELLTLEDSEGNILQELDFSTGWPAGDNDTKETMQWDGSEWVTATATPGTVDLSEADEALEPEPVVEISATLPLDSDIVWSSENGVYILTDMVTVASSTTLTIEARTVIKARAGGAGSLVVEGNLVVNGTEESPVYFTSLLDDTLGGDSGGDGETTGQAKDWRGLTFLASSTAEVDYAVIRYAGYVGAGTQSGIDNDGGDVTLRNTTITGNFHKGIFNHNDGVLDVENSVIQNHDYGIIADGDSVSVSGSEVKNNNEYGIYAANIASLSLSNNTFSGEKRSVFITASADFTHSGNTSADSEIRGFETSGQVVNNVTWHSSDLPIVLTGGVTVQANKTLTISSGSVLKMSSGSYIYVNGSLIAEGTKSKEIYFTSIKDDTVSGDTNVDGTDSSPSPTDWNGLVFYAGSSGSISNTTIRYSGGFSILDDDGVGRSGMFNLGGGVSLEDVTFSDNYYRNVFQSSGSFNATTTDFTNNDRGIVVFGGEAFITQSKFATTTTAINNNGTSTVDARNNWWGNSTGPSVATNPDGNGAYIYGSGPVLYDPWLDNDPTITPPHNPVIIVPGIMSSELYEDEISATNLIWPDFSAIALSITDDFLDILKMDSSGLPINPSIINGEIITEVGILANNVDYWESLLSQLYDHDLNLFPYDWRLDIFTTSELLKEKIDEVKGSTGSEKVDLVAHSMGGLIVKKYLETNGGDSIGNFIDIGTPHTGSPSAFKTLVFGDNLGIRYLLGIFNLNQETIKTISQNMSSIYQLLPSESYFSNSEVEYNYYVHANNKNLTYNQTSDYLKSSGRNSLLVDRASEFHQEIAGLNPADYGVETYNFVSCGVPTLGQIYVWDDEEYSIRLIDGDGTVPLRSAEAMPATSTYYVVGAQHALMPSYSGIKDLIVEILSGEDLPDISLYSHISTSSADCGVPDGKVVSFHSPVELHIYDDSGNHVGPNADGDIESEIDGVVYEVIGDNKFAYLPDGTDYTVAGNATDSGTFSVHIEEVSGGEVSTTTVFSNISLTQTTQTEFSIGSTTPTQVSIDSDGDGVFESNQESTEVMQGAFQPEVEEVTVTQELAVSSGGSAPAENIVEEESVQEDVEPIIQTSLEEEEILQPSPSESEVSIDATQIAIDPLIQDDISVVRGNNLATAFQAIGEKIVNFVEDVFKTVWWWIIGRL